MAKKSAKIDPPLSLAEFAARGGAARAKNMTKAERSEASRAAVNARWAAVREAKAAAEKKAAKKAATK
jgi:hypothetical protein